MWCALEPGRNSSAAAAQSTTMSYPAEISKGNGSGSMEEVSRVIIA